MKSHYSPSASSSVRPSACPGLLRIVQALDGGICRVKLAGGELSSAQAQAIAHASERHASGVLELTNRSNLQIRGVRLGHEEQLISTLLDSGVGPEHAASDDVRNLMLSPAAGLDPQALIDTRPLAADLLALLQRTPALHALSPKFAIQLDGGEALSMLTHPHDIWLSALPGSPRRLAFGLAGCPTDAPLGQIQLDQAVPFIEVLLNLFLELAGDRHSRMRQLLAEIPAPVFLQRLQGRLPFNLEAEDGEQQANRTLNTPPGIFDQRQKGLVMIAAASRLGRITSKQLSALAELAEQHAAGQLRVTPWQGVLLPDVPVGKADLVAQAMVDLGLMIDSGDPLTRLVACTGSAGCAKGLADTKADAMRLTARLEAARIHPAVHLSGCPRSCAAAHIAPFTLLADESGRYLLYQRTTGEAGFGQLQARDLDIEAAGDWFADHCPPGNSDA